MQGWALPELAFNESNCNFASGNNYICSTNDFNTALLSPPVRNGLVGLYTAEQWNGIHWADTSGSGNHVTRFGGTITKSPSGINGRSYIYGNTGSWLIWPAAILPSTYSLFHVAKYNNGVKLRIFTSNGNTAGINWLSGFWGGNSGVAYHNGWLGNQAHDCCGYDWVVSTDLNALYR